MTDFPGSRTSLHVGWVLLLAMLVAAWVGPSWRPGTRLVAWVLDVGLTLLTFLPTGTWLALAGTLALVRAVSTLTGAPPPISEGRAGFGAEPRRANAR
ncbi:hypothetical protein GA0070607_0081 [Micromonospora coriariae]|uniref:Uncharacterized protein n=1 Tax=Micromonospora coriariae TaxID=285665 RepID=A0A1C4U372_9ACTN|nr:hypothetical protein [Micromonospora coriariae]SCE66106.1 hypothetical protein GA0070607_0081 [Micromonospora coriariae]